MATKKANGVLNYFANEDYAEGRLLPKQKNAKISKLILILQTVICLLIAVALGITDKFFLPIEYLTSHAFLPDVQSIQQGETRFHFLSAGEGGCTIIEFSDGKNVIIDGGGSAPKNAKSVFKHINALSITHFDAVILTSMHEQAVGCLPDLIKVYSIGKLYLPIIPTSSETENLDELTSNLADNQIEYVTRYGGFASADYSLTFLSPNTLDRFTADQKQPYAQTVIFVRAHNCKAILAGQISSQLQLNLIYEDKAFNSLVATDGASISLVGADVIKTSSNAQLLCDYVRPKQIIVDNEQTEQTDYLINLAQTNTNTDETNTSQEINTLNNAFLLTIDSECYTMIMI